MGAFLAAFGRSMKRLIPRLALPTALLLATTAIAEQLTPTPTPHPAPPPMDDLRFLRMKISAGDLMSAESILEVHRTEKGEDGEYLLCLAWLARGAAITGDWAAAARYARPARNLATTWLGTPADYTRSPEAVYALGTSIEVEAQALVNAGKAAEAVRFLDASSRSLEKAPYNLRARVWKRRNLIELAGQKAPDFSAEDHLGAPFPGLEALRGKPVVLFLWWEACGDCRMQAPALRRTVQKYAPAGVVFVAPTRFYHADRSEERPKIEKAWREIYDLPDTVSAPISDEAMLRYGVSATPTFVFVDRKGVVRQYLPYRMTDERLSAAIEELLK